VLLGKALSKGKEECFAFLKTFSPVPSCVTCPMQHKPCGSRWGAPLLDTYVQCRVLEFHVID